MASTTDVNIRLKLESKKARAALKDLNSTLQDTAQISKSIAVGAGVAFTAATAAMTLAVVEAAKFDDQMTAVKTLLSDDTFKEFGQSLNEGFAELKTGTLDVLSEIPISSEKATTALFDLVSAGVSVAEANETLAVSGKLAVAGVTDVGVAVDGVTSVINAYGFEAKDASKIAAKFFAAQKKGKTTIEQLSKGFGKVGATANALGITFDEVLSSVASLTLGGVNTAEAYTSLNAVMTGIAKPTAEAAIEAERLGIDFSLAALEAKGLSGFLEQLNTNQKFTKESATKLFGSVEALKAIFALTGEGAETYKDVLLAVSDEQQAMTDFQNAYAESSATLVKKTELLGNKFDRLLITIGDMLIPMFEGLVNAGIGVLDLFLSMDETTKEVLLGVALFVTGLLGAVTAFATLAAGVGAFLAFWPTLVIGAAAIGAQFVAMGAAISTAAVALGAFLLPFLPIIAAVAAATAVVYGLVEAYESLTDETKDAVEAYEEASEKIEDSNEKSLKKQIEDQKAFLRKRARDREAANEKQAEKELKIQIGVDKKKAELREKDEKKSLELRAKRIEKQQDLALSAILSEELEKAKSIEKIDLLSEAALDIAKDQHKIRLDQIKKEFGVSLTGIEKRKLAEIDFAEAKKEILSKSEDTENKFIENQKKNNEKLKEDARKDAELAEASRQEFIQKFRGVVDQISKAFSDVFSGGLFDQASSIISEIGGIPAQFANAALNLDEAIVETAKLANEAIQQLPTIVKSLVNTLEIIFPKLVDTFVKAIPSMVKAFSKLAPIILKSLTKAAPLIVKAVLSALPELIALLPELFTELLSGISNVFEIVLQQLPSIILSIFDALPAVFKSFIDIIPEFVETFANNIGPIVEALVLGLTEAAPEIIEALVDSLLLEGGLERIVKALIIAVPRVGVAMAIGMVKGIQSLAGKLAEEFGHAFVGGLLLGSPEIAAIFAAIFNKSLVEPLSAPLKHLEGILGAFGIFVDAFGGAVNSILSIPQQIKDAINSANPFGGGGIGGGGGFLGSVASGVGGALGFEKGTSFVAPVYAQGGLDFVTRAPSFGNRNTDTVDAKLAVGERVFSVPENRQIIEALQNQGGKNLNITLKLSPSEFNRMVDEAIVENSVSGIGSVQVAVGGE